MFCMLHVYRGNKKTQPALMEYSGYSCNGVKRGVELFCIL